jgi:hypothetical protein
MKDRRRSRRWERAVNRFAAELGLWVLITRAKRCWQGQKLLIYSKASGAVLVTWLSGTGHWYAGAAEGNGSWREALHLAASLNQRAIRRTTAIKFGAVTPVQSAGA